MRPIDLSYPPQPPFASRHPNTAAGTFRRTASRALPVMALAVLAVAELSAHPSIAELCGKMADFPCGP